MQTKIRIEFEKLEDARFIGHLDVLRTFVRSIRRADLPLKYSEGFNPHAVMTFALPLGVGVTSECELVDITLTKKLAEDEVVERLNKFLPQGFRIKSAVYDEKACPEIVKAEYICEVISDTDININEVKNALAMKEITVDKKSKRTVKQVNIMEHIFDYEILSCSNIILKLRLVLSAGNTFNIKPEIVINGLATVCPTLNPVAIKPHRKAFLFK